MQKVHIFAVLMAFCAVSCASDVAKVYSESQPCEGSPSGYCDVSEVCDSGECKPAGEACSTATSNHNGYGYCLPGFACQDGNCHTMCGNSICPHQEFCCDFGGGPVCVDGDEMAMTTCTSCAAGYDNCDGNWANGCESLSDKQHCGSHSGCDGNKMSCAVNNELVCLDLAESHMQSCSACIAGYANCDNNLANGCETNINTDNAHCGSCNQPCSGVCSNGQCNSSCTEQNQCTANNGAVYCIGTENHVDACEVCTSGFGNCDNNWVNGCESDLNTNAAHCGSCETDCGARTCYGGHCVDPCNPGEERCGDAASSYCINLGIYHLSGCEVCAAGYDNCNSDWTDGCETTLGTHDRCSACGDACQSAQVCSKYQCSDDCDGSELKCIENGTAFCMDAAERHMRDCNSCMNNYANCNDSFSDGCETNLMVMHMSDCNTCLPGFANCDNNWANGCEIDLEAAHRKTCDACKDDYCMLDGICISNDNDKACGASCMNCAGLPHAVSGICSEGACFVETCEDNYDFCNGLCVDLMTDVNNCGACGVRCSGNCVNGLCVGGETTKTCGATGGEICASPDSCCTNLTSGETSCRVDPGEGYYCYAIDNKDCGISHRDCTKEPNAVEGVCAGGGLCQVIKCQFSFHLSSLDPGNECIGNMHDACGPVDNTAINCQTDNHATKGICTKGYCISSSCATGYSLCNGVCVDLKSNPYNCGVCGRICRDSVCDNGTCDNTSTIENSCLVEYGAGCSNAEQCCTNLVTTETMCSLDTMSGGASCVSMNINSCGEKKVNCENQPHASSVKCMGGSTCQIIKCKSGYHVDKEAPGNQCIND